MIDKIFRRRHDFSFVKNLENQIMIFILDNKNERIVMINKQSKLDTTTMISDN